MRELPFLFWSAVTSVRDDTASERRAKCYHRHRLFASGQAMHPGGTRRRLPSSLFW